MKPTNHLSRVSRTFFKYIRINELLKYTLCDLFNKLLPLTSYKLA